MAIIEINTRAYPAFIDTSMFPSGGASIYTNMAAFPSAAANPGMFAIANDTGALYCSFGGNWCFMLILVAGT